MKQQVLLIVVSQLLIAGLVSAQQPPRGSGRRSADGVEFPAEMERRPVQVNVPLIGEALGRIPDRVADRVYSSEKSKAELERRVKVVSRLEWFATGIAGSDIAMMRLTDGRVSLMCLMYANMPEARFKQVSQEIERFMTNQSAQNFRPSGGVPIACEIVRRGKTGAQFIAGFTPANWYVLTHNPKPEVAAGIKEGKALVGMTEQELKLVMGEPKTVTGDNQALTKELVWEKPKEFHVAVMLEEPEIDLLSSFGRPMQSSEGLTAEVRNGVVVGLRKPGAAGQ